MKGTLPARGPAHLQWQEIWAEEERRIAVVVERAKREGTIGVPQHQEPSTVMQFVANWIGNIDKERLSSGGKTDDD